MEEEKVAILLANLFPPSNDEHLNIFIKQNKFIVVNFSVSKNKLRKYRGEINKSKIRFKSRDGIELAVNIKHIKEYLTPTKVGSLNGYNIWTINNKNLNIPLILPYQKMLEE